MRILRTAGVGACEAFISQDEKRFLTVMNASFSHHDKPFGASVNFIEPYNLLNHLFIDVTRTMAKGA